MTNSNGHSGADSESSTHSSSTFQIRPLLIGLFASNLGDGATLFAIPWLVSSGTSNALTLSLLMLAGRAPYLFASIPVGNLADKREPAGLMLASSIFRIAVLGVLIMVSQHVGALVWVLGTAAFFIGLSDMVFDTAAEVAVVRMARPDDLARVNGHVRTIELVTGDLIGRPIGAALLKVGQTVPFLANLVLSLVSLAAVWPLRGAAAPREPVSPALAAGRSKGGFGLVARHPSLRLLALLSMVLTFFYNAMLGVQVLFVREVLRTGAFGFALLLALAAVSSVAGSQLAGRVRTRPGGGLEARLRGSLAAMALAFFLQSVARSTWTALPGYLLGGAAVAFWAVSAATARQRICPPDVVGRVSGVFRVITWGAGPLGITAGGLYASTTKHWLGAPASLWSVFMIGGIACAVMLVTCWIPISRVHANADDTQE
ncbi:MFS transporter [Streptomyces sp. NBC_01262]|uniref:MFS transporter n=1 Tax=Streptomyces sp. NBC_01262 TaxID=2903803 RepID=UPI002E37A2F1|nr:MFS transporter [Streptomyces sp. NBC_01262]